MTENGTTTGAGTTPVVVIERTIDAPIGLVWRMWTEPAHFAAWYGPDGASVPVAEMDVQVGGARRVAMEMGTPDGPRRMWFIGEFRVVNEPDRLVYTEAMADEEGTVLEPAQLGLPAGHPTVTEITVELTDLGGTATALVLTHAGIEAGSPGEAGWRMALDKLAAHASSVGG